MYWVTFGLLWHMDGWMESIGTYLLETHRYQSPCRSEALQGHAPPVILLALQTVPLPVSQTAWARNKWCGDELINEFTN